MNQLMSRPRCTLQTGMSLEEEVEREGVSDCRVHHGSSGEIAGLVKVLVIQTEETHVVSLSAHDKCDLSVSGYELGAGDSPWGGTWRPALGQP